MKMIAEKKLSLNIIVCILVFGICLVYSDGVFGESWRDKPVIDTEQEVSVIINFSDKVDLAEFKKTPKKLRRKKIIETLKENAYTSQKHVQQFLATKKATKTRQLWLINALAVTAGAETIEQVGFLPGVDNVIPDHSFYLPEAAYSSPQVAAESDNLNAIGAPELWDAGYTGQGITIASMDTGVDVNHPDIIDKWRGGSNSWFDVHGQYSTPYDNNGHGTQTMGIMVGGIQFDSQVPMGVAPDANWIAVRIFNNNLIASTSDIIAGLQWLASPGGDPNYAPDIVNISWGYHLKPDQCFEYDVVGPAIQVLKEAGIAVVCAAGDSGELGSISPANYPETFAVGAVDNSNNILFVSGQGPSPCDGSIFPNVVAPGINIPTTDLSFGGWPVYTTLSQTSAAAPHVSGAMALLLSAFPDANISQLEWALQKTALDLGTEGLDNYYGHGLIDVLKAYELISVDLSRNQRIDFSDFSLLADKWLENSCSPPDWCGRADTDRNFEVNLSDLQRLSIYWLEE
jgi:bacillopeptidase F